MHAHGQAGSFKQWIYDSRLADNLAWESNAPSLPKQEHIPQASRVPRQVEDSFQLLQCHDFLPLHRVSRATKFIMGYSTTKSISLGTQPQWYNQACEKRHNYTLASPQYNSLRSDAEQLELWFVLNRLYEVDLSTRLWNPNIRPLQ